MPLQLNKFLLLLSGLVFAGAATASDDKYIGSEICSSCHAEQFNDWKKSHHEHAMAEASEQSVLGDFNNTRFTYNGITSLFYKREDKFFVKTENAKGELQEFQITYTFGYEPLQQYLIDFPNGRKQVLSIIWDTRPKTEGGQRWYHLYPEHDSLSHGQTDTNAGDPIGHDDALHWTGSYFNWNSRCASCHSTDLKKNYSKTSNSYNTDWFEVNVGCESCHGPGSEHLKWAQGKGDIKAGKGWRNSLADQGIWQAVETLVDGKKNIHHTLKRQGPKATQQHQTCASCHSRRSGLADLQPSGDFHQQHSLRLLESPLYYADGQILDEVFVYGSFLQSKMHAEGVTCSNCHNPHSLELKAGSKEDSNPVCAQCHVPAVFDTPEHHHHKTGSAGAQCVSCHMPETTYMSVDPRRDHSLRIPRPDLSDKIGSPNACTQCHSNQSNTWAAKSVDSWLKASGKILSPHPFAETFYRADNGDAGSAPELLNLAQNPQIPSIVRASAIARLNPYHGQPSIMAAEKWLKDSDPLIRRAATTSLEGLPLQLRYGLLKPHLTEKVLSVRLEMARILADAPIYQLPAKEAAQLEALYGEFIQSAEYNADSPEGQTLLGSFYLAQQDFSKARKAYQQALKISPKYEGALLNLADYYRGNGQDDKALPLLKQAVANAPESANAHFSLGLLYIRSKQMPLAIESLAQASKLAYSNPRYAFTYALALEKNQQQTTAANYLQQWLKDNGSHPQVQQVLSKLQQSR